MYAQRKICRRKWSQRQSKHYYTPTNTQTTVSRTYVGICMRAPSSQHNTLHWRAVKIFNSRTFKNNREIQLPTPTTLPTIQQLTPACSINAQWSSGKQHHYHQHLQLLANIQIFSASRSYWQTVALIVVAVLVTTFAWYSHEMSKISCSARACSFNRLHTQKIISTYIYKALSIVFMCVCGVYLTKHF